MVLCRIQHVPHLCCQLKTHVCSMEPLLKLLHWWVNSQRMTQFMDSRGK